MHGAIEPLPSSMNARGTKQVRHGLNRAKTALQPVKAHAMQNCYCLLAEESRTPARVWHSCGMTVHNCRGLKPRLHRFGINLNDWPAPESTSPSLLTAPRRERRGVIS